MFVSVSILKTQAESIRGISDKSMDNPPDWPLIDQSASSSTDHGKDESQELFQWKSLSTLVREDINRKKMFSFGHCPNEGAGGLPMPEFFGPFSRTAFLVNKKSVFLQKCQCIEPLTVF